MFGPAARYAFVPRRAYTPPEASVDELLAFQRRLGFTRVVVVQPSVYGTDNACTLDALRRLGRRARGVAVIDENTSLEPLHEKGVRGVRINMQTSGRHDAKLVEQAAARVAPLGWHVQVFTTIAVLKQLGELPVPLVVDHFGLARDRAECEYLARRIRREDVYVKLSAPHRLSTDAEPLARLLIEANPARCLWGSDWPHTPRGARDPGVVQPFDAIDDAAVLERLRRWVGDEALFRKILEENPARLYDFQTS